MVLYEKKEKFDILKIEIKSAEGSWEKIICEVIISLSKTGAFYLRIVLIKNGGNIMADKKNKTDDSEVIEEAASVEINPIQFDANGI